MESNKFVFLKASPFVHQKCCQTLVTPNLSNISTAVDQFVHNEGGATVLWPQFSAKAWGHCQGQWLCHILWGGNYSKSEDLIIFNYCQVFARCLIWGQKAKLLDTMVPSRKEARGNKIKQMKGISGSIFLARLNLALCSIQNADIFNPNICSQKWVSWALSRVLSGVCVYWLTSG